MLTARASNRSLASIINRRGCLSPCLAPLAGNAQDARPETGQTQLQEFQQAQQQNWREMAKQRQQVLLKQQELSALMLNPETTEDELLKKQKELQEARNQLEREQLAFRFQMQKKIRKSWSPTA